MYFENFPVITYKKKDVTNLLRRVAIRSKVKTNTLFFDTYDVKEGETPEIIADKLYGDSQLHWIIMLVNNIVDRYHEWPMSGNQFLDYVNEKYSNPSAIHHYEIEQSSGDTSVKIDIGADNTDYPTATAITNYEYEVNEQDEKRKIRLLDPRFTDDFVTEFKELMKESII
jgi:hypothetical protein